MQRITPFLWFDGEAEEAAKFYCSIFDDSKITGVTRYGDAGPGPKGSVMVCTFQLQGQDFMALNGGPQFEFTEAISFMVNCETQAEVDLFWDKLSDGGAQVQCGWLKDKYGLSWQIVPTVLGKMMQDKDPQRANRVMLSHDANEEDRHRGLGAGLRPMKARPGPASGTGHVR